MPFINIKLIEGRTKEEKARVAEKITELIQEEMPGIPKEAIWVVFEEKAKSDWATGGKMLG